jgi:hypothetical protein
MKRNLTLLTSALACTWLLSGCVLVENGYFNICPDPSGYVTTRERNVPDFWAVKVLDSRIRVYMEQSPYTYVDVVADDNLQDYIETYVAADGVLEVWYTGPDCTTGGVREVYVGGDYIQVLKRAGLEDNSRTDTTSVAK